MTKILTHGWLCVCVISLYLIGFVFRYGEFLYWNQVVCGTVACILMFLFGSFTFMNKSQEVYR